MNYEETYRNFDEEYKKLYAAAQTGMTLRDYFAAKAMCGVIAATEPLIKIDESHLAMWSYKMADAMLKAREA